MRWVLWYFLIAKTFPGINNLTSNVLRAQNTFLKINWDAVAIAQGEVLKAWIINMEKAFKRERGRRNQRYLCMNITARVTESSTSPVPCPSLTLWGLRSSFLFLTETNLIHIHFGGIATSLPKLMFCFHYTAFRCLSILPSLWTFWWAPVCLSFAQLHVVLQRTTPLFSTLLPAFWKATTLQPLKRNACQLSGLLWLLHFCFSELCRVHNLKCDSYAVSSFTMARQARER